MRVKFRIGMVDSSHAICMRCGGPIGIIQRARRRQFCCDAHEYEERDRIAQLALQRLWDAARASGPPQTAPFATA
jgi:hypothetical protein